VLADVSKLEDCQRSVAEAVAGLGHVDVLVNKAGILRLATIEETTPEHWDQNRTSKRSWTRPSGRKAWGSGAVRMRLRPPMPEAFFAPRCNQRGSRMLQHLLGGRP
jgi:hypothetical protein